MSTPFWTFANQLASLPGFAAVSAEQEGDELHIRMQRVDGPERFRVAMREGRARDGELSLGPVALTYALEGLDVADASAHAFGPWVHGLAQSYATWRALRTPPSSLEDGLRRMDGTAPDGPLTGFRMATPLPSDGASAPIALDFGEPVGERRVLLDVSPASSGAPARVGARHRTPAPLEVQEAIRVASAVALGMRSRGASARGTGKQSLEVITAPEAYQGREVRLILNGPCRQHCAFCSIPDTFPPSDEGETELAGHRAVLEARFAGGARVLRLTGVDPLAASFVLPLIAHATALGFEEVMINSPCTRFSDRSFAEAIAIALPARRGVMVPLYGADAESHDAVVGRVGAHAEVMQALDHLRELLGAWCVQLSTVLVPAVLDRFDALVMLARARALPLNVYLPFPDADSPFDRFTKVTLPQTEIAARLVASDALTMSELFAVRGLAPCVILRAMKEASSPRLAEAEAFLARPTSVIHDGARTAHQPCAHRDRCALTPPCSGELLSAYVSRHGDAEFAPPSR